MKFSLHLGRSCRPMYQSSSQPKCPDSQLVGDLYADSEKQRPVDSGGQLPTSSLVAPPPYTTVVAPGIHTSPLPGSSETSESFNSPDRLRDVAYLQAPMRRESEENALEMLRTYDTVIIMDDSASMLQDRRWEQACEALSGLAQIAATHDRDGIDIHFLNHSRYGVHIKDSAGVRQLFRHVHPQGLTPIANKLDILVGDYIEKLEQATRKKWKGEPSALKQIKPANFIVITDGVPTDEPSDSIVSLARRLDRGNYPLAQVGIQFVQIGDDKGATEFLKQLDDDLSGSYGIRDIVDTTPFLGIKLTAEMLIKILLGGVNRRVDRHGGGAVMAL